MTAATVTIVENVASVTPSAPVTTVVELGVAGPQGPAGPTGATGPTGPQGAPGASTSSYRHVQGAAASTWTIAHNLQMYPNVTVIDSSGRIVEGEIAYPNANTVVLTFTGAFSGEAYLS